MKINKIITLSLMGLVLSACHNHTVDSVNLYPVPNSTSQVLPAGTINNNIVNKVGYESIPVPTSTALTYTPAPQRSIKPVSQNQEFISSMNILGFETRETARGVVVYLPTSAHFKVNSSAINTAMNSRLQQFVSETNKGYVSHRSVIVSGHTDAIGPDNANQELSTRRANAVEKHLVSLGSSSSRLSSQGFGESYPRFSNGSQQHLNRRVEFLVLN